MRNQRSSDIVWNFLGILGFLCALLFVIETKAQLNPSSAVLVRPSGKTPDPKTLSPDRYTIKPSGSIKNSRPPTSVSVESALDPAAPLTTGPGQGAGGSLSGQAPSVTAGTISPATAGAGPTTATASATASVSATAPTSASASASALGATSTPSRDLEFKAQGDAPLMDEVTGAAAAEAQEDPGAPTNNGTPSTKTATELTAGGTHSEMRSYKNLLHSEDRRHNIIEIFFAPAYIVNSSQANHSYRQYNATGLGFLAGADVWLTPELGLHTALMSSIGSDIQAVYGGQNRLRVEHQFFDVGLKWRRFFGLARSAPSMTLGVAYSEYQLRVPMDAVQRQALRTSGFQLEVEAKFPSTPQLTWNFGASLAPWVIQQEIDTGASWRSGVESETGIAGVWVGAEHIFDRRHVVFWQLQHRLEKTIYSGSATTLDPATGTVPAGIVVDNSFFLFSLGLRWGN